ncbi:MAG: aromatic ring-hydroxylating dioxygenase subunit alpha [Alphaproteobacteria bacterium]|nr:aromatic ring-hydroxylating dioxygenase subunit alpha [Alphaproteobacteria bacterium]
MLSRAENDLVTQTGPGTRCGALMRRYWQPAALAEELDPRRPVKALRLLGEDLVLFRGGRGLGLIGRHCAHRGTDLAFGRLENEGLRCCYHGWLYDATGQCLEQPAEPAGSSFHRKVRLAGYPCVERNGIVFAYMGAGPPPPFPEFDCFAAPDAYTFAYKGHIDCNWLQLLEGGIDPCHVSFLHRFFEDGDPTENYGRQFRDQMSDGAGPLTRILRDFDCPTIDTEETEYGLRIFALRAMGAKTHVRVTNLVFPNLIVIPLSDDMIISQWHVPIDDGRSWWYDIFSSYSRPMDKAAMRAQRTPLIAPPDYVPTKNRGNSYGYDPDEQRTRTYTGMGEDINVHDAWAVESAGPIQDRTTEHLGASDKAIIANRRLLIRAIGALESGATPPALGPALQRLRGPVSVDMVGTSAGWRDEWRGHDERRRARSPWAAALQPV